jgi:uncharacterized membrane protein YhaH (DUF805 family)
MIVEWMLMPLRRYFDFEGRSRRTEYWMFFLLHFILLMPPLFMVIAGIIANPESNELSGITIAGFGFMFLIWLVFLIPMLAVQVRRFHDQDKSGCWGLFRPSAASSFSSSCVWKAHAGPTSTAQIRNSDQRVASRDLATCVLDANKNPPKGGFLYWP